MSSFIQQLEESFSVLQNSENAFWMTKYMRNQFAFLGIQKTERHAVFVDLYKQFGKQEDWLSVSTALFDKNEREFHYIAMEFLMKKQKEWDGQIPGLVEQWILKNSWWDVVDVLAPKIIGPYFLMFPDQKEHWISRWMNSGNFWLQRVCIIFQLLYKSKTDTQLLASVIHQLSSSKEFFIQKAIGWSLRQYARTDPEWVIQFVESNHLALLSKREALRRVKISY
ncbi:DNA alkylation repair protein [Aquirufa sp. ROCK2-A2]